MDKLGKVEIWIEKAFFGNYSQSNKFYLLFATYDTMLLIRSLFYLKL